MIIDTHCHYNLEPLFSGQPSHFHLKKNSPLLTMSWKDHWQEAQKHDVTGALIVGTTYESTQTAVELANQTQGFLAALGIHPNHSNAEEKIQKRLQAGEKLNAILSSQTEYLIQKFSKLAAQHPDAIVAVGETGLDYFYLPENPQRADQAKQIQESFLSAHLKIAARANLVPILHVRDKNIDERPESGSAYWKTLESLKKDWPENKPFILHCVSGPAAYVGQALEMGAYLGIAGNSTYHNADQLRDLVKLAPKDRLLLETDAPYLPPQSHRGKICEPWMISETASFLQTELQIASEQLHQNTLRLFPAFAK